MKLGEIIKEYRKDHDLSQRQFAKLCGLSHAYVPLIERGTSSNGTPLTPSITVLKQIASAMGITLQDLMAKMDDDLKVDISIEENSENAIEEKTYPLSFHEYKVIEAYRANSSMQSAVDKLLGVEEDTTTIEEDAAETFRRVSKKSVHQ